MLTLIFSVFKVQNVLIELVFYDKVLFEEKSYGPELFFALIAKRSFLRSAKLLNIILFKILLPSNVFVNVPHNKI